MAYISKIVSAVGLVLLISATAQAEIITPDDAARNIGKYATVEGVVSQVAHAKGVTFINMGGRYPNHSFYGVIFRDYADQFNNIRSLEGKTVAISGNIENYKGKPQVILYSSDQLTER